MQATITELDREEEEVMEILCGLKDKLVQVSSQGRTKLEEIRQLTRRVAELKCGAVKKKSRILKENNLGGQHVVTILPEKIGCLIPPANYYKKIRQDILNEHDYARIPWRKISIAIFPTEIWKMIIENVSNPKDLWSLCNTCQLFDAILSKWKTGWLFGQALPYIYKDLPGEKLLDTRLVCRSWKASADNFLLNHPSARPHDPDQINPRRLDFVNPIREKRLRRDVIGHQDFWDFRDEPESGPIPVIGRFVDIFLESGGDGDYKRLLDDARRYFNHFGKGLWYLEIAIPGPKMIADESIHSNFIQFITIDLLRLVPNVRRLDMTYIHVTNVGFGNLSEIELGSIPDAPHLDTFQNYNTNHEDAMSEALLNRFHLQIRKLCLTASSWGRVCHLGWGNLTELQLTYIQDLEHLRSLREVGMPHLSKLRFNFTRLGRDMITFDNLLKSIHELCQRTPLSTIRLDGGLQVLGIGQVGRNKNVTPAIKTLELDHVWGARVPCYTFLLSCFPLIENLHLFVRDTDDSYGPEIDLRTWEDCLELAEDYRFQEVFEIVEINEYIYRRQMYRSNIWELLPQLKVFSFQWDIYTRHGYEEYLEKKKAANASSNFAS